MFDLTLLQLASLVIGVVGAFFVALGLLFMIVAFNAFKDGNWETKCVFWKGIGFTVGGTSLWVGILVVGYLRLLL